MAGRTVKAGGLTGGREPSREGRPAGETGEARGKAEEARAVPDARAAGVETGKTVGDAEWAGLALRAWRALAGLPRGAGRGFAALFGRSGDAAKALRSGGPSNEGDAVDLAAADRVVTIGDLAKPISDPRVFFKRLSPHHSGLVALGDEVRRGEVHYLGEGEPIPRGELVGYREVESQQVVAGMIGPDLGFVVDARTGRGSFIQHQLIWLEFL
ncbi:MAG: hypothetical protein HYU97_00095 [Deltaproteobacteria bacterium]|nr:hypothetical protein [Deltaproteobacteria bacterium]